MLIKSKWYGGLLLGALSLGLGWGGFTVRAQASYNSMFNREAYFAKHEKLDATTSFDRRLSPYRSVYVTQNQHGVIRNVSLLAYNKRQGKRFNHYAQHWINVRTLKNGKVYAYNDQTVYGHYLVSYHELAKGKQATIKAGKTAVKVSYSRAGNVLFNVGKTQVVAHLKTGQVRLNGRLTAAAANRTFKKAVPTTGSRVQRLIKDAKRYVGVPYRYAGRDAFGGLDCATFVNQVYLDVEHRDIGGMTGVQEKLGKHVAVTKAKAGDLLFWKVAGQKYTYHVAMATGHGQLIEEAGKSVHLAKIKTRRPQFAIHMH